MRKYSELPGKIDRSLKVKSTPYKGNDLLIEAGYIRPFGTGYISYLPLGKRVLNNIIKLINEHMDELGGLEISVPLISSETLWDQGGRLESDSSEITRFKDRKGKNMILSPTHEEAVTTLLKDEINSYKDLPLFVYQNQLKYRDEMRPRGYLIRSREFMMHDGYSFHKNFVELNNFFPRVYAAYESIMKSCGIDCMTSEADSGFMRGSRSYEFILPHKGGKNIIMNCPHCGYRANRSIAYSQKKLPLKEKMRAKVNMPQGEKVDSSKMITCQLYRSHERYFLALYRADHKLSIDKLKIALDLWDLSPATEEESRKKGLSHQEPSPFKLPDSISTIADHFVVKTPNLAISSGEQNVIFGNVNYERDFSADKVADIIKADEGDDCRICANPLEKIRGIELAHIFRLDDFYTKKYGLTFQGEKNRSHTPLMGSYGIGLGRLLYAIAESNRDEKGLIWPVKLAPYHYYIMGISKSPTIKKVVFTLAEELGESVLVDDRREGIGVKLRDCNLLGIPIRIIVSQRYLETGEVEIYIREDNTIRYVKYDDLPLVIETWEKEQGIK